MEELDFQPSPIGDISLRRRFHPALQVDLYEVILGEEHLMSSVFTVAEEELGRLAVAACAGDGLDVVVGGLGLGYTARAVLESPRVRSVQVVEYLAPVLDWHRRGLVPLGPMLTGDARCALVEGDFFALAAAGALPAPVHVIALDIDHSPAWVLHPSHAALYTEAGLLGLAQHLHPGGVFALWSDAAPDPEFVAVLSAVFTGVRAEVVRFANPLTGGESSNTVYVAVRP